MVHIYPKNRSLFRLYFSQIGLCRTLEALIKTLKHKIITWEMSLILLQSMSTCAQGSRIRICISSWPPHTSPSAQWTCCLPPFQSSHSRLCLSTEIFCHQTVSIKAVPPYLIHVGDGGGVEELVGDLLDVGTGRGVYPLHGHRC